MKRIIDIMASVVGLLLLSPLLLVCGVLIKLVDSGPIFYKGVRVGRYGKTFRIYKFRTMVVNAEKLGGPSTADDDSRITKVGESLRRYKLDELPQLINVFRGEMTIVGPRPPLTYEIDHYKEWHKGRLVAKPGLTGLWQVSGRSSVSFDEMVMLDLYYIENWSVALDLKIILRTIPVMLFGVGGY